MVSLLKSFLDAPFLSQCMTILFTVLHLGLIYLLKSR